MEKPKIKITKKPDDVGLIPGKPILRISAGGHQDVGFYLVYRGDIKDIIHMLSVVMLELTTQFVEGIEHPIEPEDGKHK